MIHHGLSLYPGGTKMAVPHLKEGIDNSKGGVGWGYYDREEMWLHNLYTSIPELSFEDLEPAREKNSFSFWGSNFEEPNLDFEMSLSPAYRWNFGFHYDDDIYRSWLEYDLYSSYLIRLWTGAGLQYNGQELDALVQARL